MSTTSGMTNEELLAISNLAMHGDYVHTTPDEVMMVGLQAVAAAAWDAGVTAKSNSASIFDRDVLAMNPYRRLCLACDTTSPGSHRIWCSANALVVDPQD